jgi:hypothetical protein
VTKREVLTLEEGEVVLEWPAPLSAESYETLERWLERNRRKIKFVDVPWNSQACTPAEPGRE